MSVWCASVFDETLSVRPITPLTSTCSCNRYEPNWSHGPHEKFNRKILFLCAACCDWCLTIFLCATPFRAINYSEMEILSNLELIFIDCGRLTFISDHSVSHSHSHSLARHGFYWFYLCANYCFALVYFQFSARIVCATLSVKYLLLRIALPCQKKIDTQF